MTSEDALWRAWRARWNRFQEAYVPHREQQFTLLADYISLVWRTDDVRMLDLCSGTGSVGERLVETLPRAEIVAVDIDPWLLELGRRTSTAAAHVTCVDADLRGPAWVDALPHREFHGAVLATATRWFEGDELARLYEGVATVLMPGGLFLIADAAPAGTSEVQRLARAATRPARPPTEEWPVFWREARSVPEFRELFAERDRRLGSPGSFLAKSLAFHEEALVAAGFRERGEVWRCHENAVLLAIR